MLLCSVAMISALATPAHSDDTTPKGSFRVLTFNTWGERFSGRVANMSSFFKGGNYDIIAIQELSNKHYLDDLPGMLKDQWLGDYKAQRAMQDSGILTRLPGSTGTSSAGYGIPNVGNGGVALAFIDAQNGLPKMTVGSTHLDWRDESGSRLMQAKALNELAASSTSPFLLTGDFNAGDVSERGLNRSIQQALLYTHLIYDSAPSALWKQLGREYAPDGKADDAEAYVAAMRATDSNGKQKYRNVLQTYFDNNRSEFPGKNSISDLSWQQWASIIEKDMASSGLELKDETYPVASNTPVTMNVLKKNYILLTDEAHREIYAPLAAGDGISTWTSAGEDDTNTWASWDHVKIDHFLAARPFGKWFTLADDPKDPYVGVMESVSVGNDGTPLSDHNTVAHTVRWVGPVLADYAGDPAKKTVIWGADASTFGEEKTAYVAGDGKKETLDGSTFYLTRNNARTDVRLGQIADENGNPILEGLTLDEKKQVLDCYSKDARLKAAIAEYCIDDHSFIGETQIKDGGTVIVDEDLALGNANAALKLDNGTLRIAGTSMTSLERNVVLEGKGTLDVASADNLVTAPGVISGSGSLTKAGTGALNLTGTNTYTGETTVAAGALFVNGSIEHSRLTTVEDGALLGGNGTLGGLLVKKGGTVAPGNSIGRLMVDGDVTFDPGSTYKVEIDADGHADQIVASGAATIKGGTLASVAANGNYRPDTSYSVLLAAGGVTGSFEEVVTNMAFLTPFFETEGNTLNLAMVRNDIDFSAVATTSNAAAVANAIEGVGPGTIYNAIVGLDAGTANAAFGQMTGELYPSLMGALAEDSHFFRDAVSARYVGGIAMPSAKEEANAKPYSVWSHAYGAHGRTEGDGVSSLDRDTGGFYFGADTAIDGNLSIGALAGYGHSSFSLHHEGDKADADTYLVGLYGAASVDALRFTFGASYSYADIDSDRTIDISPLSQTLKGSYDASTVQAFGEAAYAFTFDTAMIEPYAGLAQVHVSTDGFTESGGTAALGVDDADMDVTYMSLGVRAAQRFALGDRSALLSGQIGWRHAFGDVTPETAMTISGSAPFDIAGAPINEDAATVNAGIDFDVSESAKLYLNYAGQFAADGSDNGVNAGLKVAF